MNREITTGERSEAVSEHRIGLQRGLPGPRTTPSIKLSAVQLIGLIGIALIVAVYLLPQLNKLPNTSFSYSVLSAVISLLVNFSSSALQRIFCFLISVFGLSKSFDFGQRLQ